MGKKKTTSKKKTKKATLKKKPAPKKGKAKKKKTTYGVYIDVPANTAYVKKIPANGPPYLDAVICANGDLPPYSATERVILVACIVKKGIGAPPYYSYSYVPAAGATRWQFDPVGGITPSDPNGTRYYFKLAVTIQDSISTAVRTVTDSQGFDIQFRATTDCGT